MGELSRGEAGGGAQAQEGGVTMTWITFGELWFGVFVAGCLVAGWAIRRNRREAASRRALRRWISAEYGK